VTPRRTPADVLRQARQQDSRTKRGRVLAVVAKMLEDQEPITFASVARGAEVSHWLVYADGVREHIDHARRQQAQQATRTQAAKGSAAPAGLKTELEVLREDNRRLRHEREQLQRALRSDLGRQLDQIGTADLGVRIDELTAANQKLSEELASAKQELADTQDSLAAARASLRRMIRSENQTHH
jgi:predicted  nucleic acid-binding Zn-ribbon protein